MLLPRLAEFLEGHVPELAAQALSNILWAIATHGLRELPAERMPSLLAERAVETADALDAQGVAKLRADCPGLLQMLPVIGEVAANRAGDMTSQALANFFWAVAALREEAARL